MELDYRLEEAEYLYGRTFIPKAWHRPEHNTDWNHDHCSACWARIWDHPEDEAGSFGEGYAIVGDSHWRDDYHWLCAPCFQYLRGPLDLKELKVKS